MSTAEVIKLDNLQLQEELWLKLEIEESFQEAKVEFHRNVSEAGIKKQVQPEVKVHGEEKKIKTLLLIKFLLLRRSK